MYTDIGFSSCGGSAQLL